MTAFLRTAAASLGALAGMLAAATLVLALQTTSEDVLEGSLWTAAALALAVIGAFIAVRRPRHAVGWLLLMAGLGEIAAGASNLYGEHVTASGARLPLAAEIGWWGGSVWAFSAAALLVFLPLYFPTGRPPSRRWRWVGWLGAAGIALLLTANVDIALFRPELIGLEWDAVEAAAGDRPLFVISELGFPVLLAAAPLALLSLIVRFLRAQGEERQQIKLLVLAAALTVAFILTVNVTDLPRIAEAAGSAIAMPSIGIATMVAVLRYRLYDIDRIVSRTLAYAILTLLLVGIYLAAVTALTALTAPVTGESPIAVAAATLLAAAVFQPARRRIQAAVDKRFNRARYDAQRTLESFASSLRQEVDIDDVNAHLVTTVGEVLQPATVAVWLRPKGAST